MNESRGLGLLGGLVPLIAAMASVCIGNSFAKALFPLAGASGTNALRLGLSALLLIALFRPWRWQIGRVGWVAVVPYGMTIAAMNLCFYMALRTLPLGIAIAIEFLGPLSIALMFSVRRADYLWIACAALGVASLTLPGAISGSSHAALDPVGLAFVLGAALAWALYIVAGKRASEILPAGQVVCLGTCVAALIAVPVGVASTGARLIEPQILAGGLVVAVLASAIPFSLEMIALKRLPRHVFGVVVSLEPAIGALAALAILGERLSLLQCLAIAALIAASVGISRNHALEDAVPPQV
ncbi:EamA family transporter [Edaphosphingomonas haloaromaticamans]|uniref:Threonine/homoserine exporter RhtA n=1 Tax=Edaphosphingomonas haloaromaticamans TaxID=653954 RepID=A0A1S1HJA3_9SPHN|nr:EamA family transporter [Sphingomonas haloaromaticamans]OHT20610.1 Threonine/homoserine exporter RhtA [Sphingomonas haloaromaticamans]